MPKEFSTFASDVETAFKSLNEQIKILSLVIDYWSYVRFRWLTPAVHLMMGGNYMVAGDGRAQSSQDYAFYYNFVIESALRLQEFTM